MDTERIAGIAAALAPEGQTADEYRARMIEERSREIPLGRAAMGTDVAVVAAFLASAESDYLTGLSIPVAGGSLMD